jgi:hypothetical protein
LTSDVTPQAPTSTATTASPDTLNGLSADNGTLGDTFGDTGGSVQSLGVSGPGSAQGNGVTPAVIGAPSDFPIRGIPPPLGWTITALLACILMAYPLLLLARWQFLAPRRR